MKASRMTCCVVGCHRTTGRHLAEGWTEWVCSVHWGLISKRKRRVWARAKARCRKYPTEGNQRACARLWGKMKHLAAMGLLG